MTKITAVNPGPPVVPKPAGLTPLQHQVLMAIEKDPSLGRIGIVATTGLKKGSINHALDALFKKGYLHPKRFWRVLKHPLTID